jgi:NADH dehydrogenase
MITGKGASVMSELTCVVVGGGYAGIHAVKAIRKELQKSSLRMRILLIDQNRNHLRKVLFKPAANDEEIIIPLKSLFPEGVDILQAAVTKIDTGERRLAVEDAAGRKHSIHFDLLVLAVGSVVRQPEPGQGGMPLTDLSAAVKIREAWCANLKKAVSEPDPHERQKLMTITVAGAGISGIETSAELAYAVRAKAENLGLDPDGVRIILLNAHSRLFPEGPAKVGRKLERILAASGVTVLHECRLLQEKDGILSLSNGRRLSAGLCVWTLGLLPMLTRFGLPLTPEGYVDVDASYRVRGLRGVYSIGDCAQIIDSRTGRPDGKTCKEASAQAIRLGKIITADLAGKPAPVHKEYMDFFCFGLGPKRGMVWTRLLGLNIVIAGKLGWRIRKFTWDLASLVK